MNQEREELLSKPKEWIVDELLRQEANRRQEILAYHSKAMAKIKFTNYLIKKLNEMTAMVKGFHDYGVLPNEAND